MIRFTRNRTYEKYLELEPSSIASNSDDELFERLSCELKYQQHARDIADLHGKILESDPLQVAVSGASSDLVYFPLLQLILQELDITRYNIPFIPIDLINIICEYLQNTVQDLRLVSKSSLDRAALVETNQLLDKICNDPNQTFGILPVGSLQAQATYVRSGDHGFARVKLTRLGPPQMNIIPTSTLISSSTNNCISISGRNKQSEFNAIFSWSVRDSRLDDYSNWSWYVLDETNQPIFCWSFSKSHSDSSWEELETDQLWPWLRKVGVLPSTNSNDTIQTPHDTVAAHVSTAQRPWTKSDDADAAATFLDAIFQTLMMGAGVKRTKTLDSYTFEVNWNH